MRTHPHTGLTVLATLLLLCMPRPVYAQFTFVTNSGKITITGYTGPGGAVTIPGTTNGLPVTDIGQAAFSNRTNVTSVSVPSSITTIRSYPPFRGCTSLAEINVDALNPSFSSVDGVLFNKIQTMLIQYPPAMHRIIYAVSSNVVTIADEAFGYCSLRGIYFYGKAPSVTSYAFYGAEPLTVFRLPGTTGWGTTFGGRPTAFWDTTTLFGYTTNGNTVSIKGYLGVDSAITIPEVLVGLPVTSLGDGAFYGYSDLMTITLPYSVTNLGGRVFWGCSSLSAITVDGANPAYSSTDGVLFNKSQTALIQCPGGRSGTYSIPNGVTNISGSAFYRCVSLTSITIPSTVISIGGSAFWYCTGVTSVAIPDGVTSIGDYAFWGCGNPTNVWIPSSVTQIGQAAFFGASLTSIAVDAANSFYSSVAGVLFNKSQTTLVEYPCGLAGDYAIPDGVTNVFPRAFIYCSSLTNVMIPASVTSLGDLALGYCPNLSEVYFQGNAPGLGSGVFDHISATIYYMPGTIGWGSSFGGLPTAPWLLPNPVILNANPSLGVQTNGFGFVISWATNLSVAVEACTSLADADWSPVGTNALTDGWSYFSDPNWTSYPARFYRLRSP